MRDTVFLVLNKKDYFYEWEPQCMRPGYMPGSIAHSVSRICQILHAESMPSCLIQHDVKDGERVIITDVCYDSCLYNTLTKFYRPEDMYLYYMNEIGPENRAYMANFPQRTFSFDQADARRFGIRYKHLPYSEKVKIAREDPEYDTLFLGVEKGRGSEIEQAASLLEQCGFSAKIMVLNSNNPRFQIPAYIPYPEYLEYVAKSKSILELNVPGQTSCTLRFLESLFLKKKLITNNQQIVTDPYYDPDNVFILGVDDRNDLREFIAQPYKDKQQDLSELSFRNWIQDW